MAEYSIRRAIQNDCGIIQELAHFIWPIAYAEVITKEQIEYMLHWMYSENALKEQMENGHQFLILQEGENPIGFASVGPLNNNVFKLHKLYVLPSNQRKGMGKFLIENAENLVRNLGGTTLILNVNRKNKSFEFYLKVGYVIDQEVDIEIGRGFFMNDFIMKKNLNI